nr:hypothetical protein CFP56_37452 [Quercus suber]
MFASKSRARIMQLKLELQTTKKGNLSMTDYLQKIKSLADSLAAAAQPIPEPDLILHILGGLSPEYESFVTSVTTRSDDLSLEDLNAMLLNQEMRINNAQISFSPEPQANIANSSSRFNGRDQSGKRMTEGELFNLIGSVAESVHGEKRLRVETKETPAEAEHVGCLRYRVYVGEEYWRYRLMIKFGFQGRREENVLGKLLGKVLEKREEKKRASGIEIQSWVLGRRVEK